MHAGIEIFEMARLTVLMLVVRWLWSSQNTEKVSCSSLPILHII